MIVVASIIVSELMMSVGGTDHDPDFLYWY